MNPKNLENQLIVEELAQRYNNYRAWDETRNKFINFYLIFYFAFFGLVGYLLKNKWILKEFPFSDLNSQLGIIFLVGGFVGMLWLASIISFRHIQVLESKSIQDIKKGSEFLSYEVEVPFDRKLPFNTLVFSVTPLVFIIFLLNSALFYLSYHFLAKADSVLIYLTIFIYLSLIVFLLIWMRKWKPYGVKHGGVEFDKEVP